MFHVQKCYFGRHARFGLAAVRIHRVDELNRTVSGFVNFVDLGYRYYFDAEYEDFKYGCLFRLTVPRTENEKMIFRCMMDLPEKTFNELLRLPIPPREKVRLIYNL